MRKITLFLIMASMVLMGCTKQADELDSGGNGTDFNLSVDLGSRATDSNATGKEGDVACARLIIIGTVYGSPYYNKVTCNKYFPLSEINSGVVRAKTRVGISDVYLLVNEPAADKAKLDAITRLDELQMQAINFAGDAVVGNTVIPMMRVFKNVNIPETGEKNVGSESEPVERAWSKVKVTFKAITGDDNVLDLSKMTINEVKLVNRPSKSYWIADAFKGTMLADKIILNSAVTVDASTPLTFYLPEYYGADKSTAVALKIKATTVGGSDVTYTLRLGEDFNAGNYNILRNRFYDVSATFRTYGEGGIDVVTDVKKWSYVSMVDSQGGYIISTGRWGYIMTGSDKVLTFGEGDNVEPEGGIVRVTCDTNIGGWFVTLRDINNGILEDVTITPTDRVPDFEHATKYVEQTFDVHVPELEDPHGRDLVLRIYSTLGSGNTLISTIKIYQYPGLVPNRFCQPQDGPRGIQVAKIGNVYPWENPRPDEEKLIKFYTGTDTPSFLDKDNHWGPGNKVAMTAHGGFPMVDVCNKLGPEWYVPAYYSGVREYFTKFRAIVNTKFFVFGWVYWMSSMYSPTSAYIYDVLGDYSGQVDNSIEDIANVRCVRDI
ncbi:MAG: hypothetical protein RSA66_09460 [Muribaculaceae bacterium]